MATSFVRSLTHDRVHSGCISLLRVFHCNVDEILKGEYHWKVTQGNWKFICLKLLALRRRWDTGNCFVIAFVCLRVISICFGWLHDYKESWEKYKIFKPRKIDSHTTAKVNLCSYAPLLFSGWNVLLTITSSFVHKNKFYPNTSKCNVMSLYEVFVFKVICALDWFWFHVY